MIQQELFPSFDRQQEVDESRIQALAQHPVHQALASCGQLRPAIDISVVA